MTVVYDLQKTTKFLKVFGPENLPTWSGGAYGEHFGEKTVGFFRVWCVHVSLDIQTPAENVFGPQKYSKKHLLRRYLDV